MVSLANPKINRDGSVLLTPASGTALAWHDLTEGFSRLWMWPALAWQDIKLRYRGSVLGPFWMTISTVAMIAGMAIIYSQLFGMDIRQYIPYLAMGLVVWQFLSGVITEGCQTFLSEATLIHEVRVPFSVHAYRSVLRNLIVLAHNMVIVPIGIATFLLPVGWHLLMVIPAIFVLALNGIWISLLFGMLSARFRDVPPIIASIMQALFFLTPVIWPVAALKEWQIIATMNPFFAALDVLRAPLIGTATADSSWPVLIAVTVIGCLVTFAVFARFRTRIPYWV
jgi:ABC-2 type transport system permease protein/lipopolysaccharide transport system permease protein